MVITELKNVEADSARTAILSFINVLIECAGDVKERDRIRAEFIGELFLPTCLYQCLW